MSNISELTPAMRQYLQLKEGLSADTILLFRMGDFYELFFDDAKTAAPHMDVVLTARAGVPMCGVPYHAVRNYIARILEAGLKVAIAEQMEDPKLARGLVKRDITQIITPGTLLDDNLLSAAKSNFLLALCPGKEKYGLAMLDLSTGDFRLSECRVDNALEIEFSRLQPSEVIVPSTWLENMREKGFPPELDRDIAWTGMDDWRFDVQVCREELQKHFGVASLDGFGCRGMDLGVAAAGAVLHYVQRNLRQDAAHITSLHSFHAQDCLVLDRISQRNLELIEPIFADGKDNTLVSVLDETVTPMGARLLREWILRPLKDKPAIEARLDAVENLLKEVMLRSELREILTAVRDLERTISRLNVSSNASARDLQVLQKGLNEVPGLKAVLAGAQAELLQRQRQELLEFPELNELLLNALLDELPVSTKDGGMIKKGYHAELDELRRASREGKDWIAAYQVKEQGRTGIKNLKVRYNKVFGYFIEVTKANLEMVPEDYLRKQTMVNAERFITPELKEIEDKVLGAEEKSRQLEYELFQELREKACSYTADIQRCARSLALIDCLASLADVAGRHNYVRPDICQEAILDIRDGRHPVLDARLTHEAFVPNDVLLDNRNNQLAIITGPNMAGKSTYIRQVALLVLMAQMGSFIPASKARIGLTDRIFTRVGAADDISRGQSTFMVEMVETANILNHATAQSLIILDEIGRGTSTFDGLSLAWAVAEYLHDNPKVKARTLFATHYHELTELALTKKGVKNYNVLVREQGENIIFVRKIMPGCADKSYGIHVARLAGIPTSVISRATEVLNNLENNEFSEEGKPKLAQSRKRKQESNLKQLELF
ncbi:MAG: DNA mismatch repair protein MutS [Oligosphaeraceae bacterium]|nr:DNA mismatch repair protein MutS [Oligosphaeraceae bacterium]